VYVERRGKLEKFDIEGVRYHKQFVLLKLKDVDDMTAAERFKGAVLKITDDMALPCGEDENYIRDLYDMEVFTDEGERLGVLTDVIFTGANDVYAVTPDEGKDILIPAIKQCILDVDVENNKMTVRLLEGLRD
jgi:16S rRNA processing protein RimM